MTYANLFEEPLCALEIGFKNNLLSSCSVLDFVGIIAVAPENLAIAELVVSGFDKRIRFHNTIIAFFSEKVKH